MATKKEEIKELSIAEKLDQLVTLQKLDSSIDEIRILRGELPLEVQDLEDEVEGLTTRLENFQKEVDEKKEDISHQNEVKKEADLLIKKYEKDQMKVRNNREFESISKEIEYQELEIKLNEKKTKEAKFKISSKKEVLDETKERFDFRKKDLESKQAELDSIIKETEKDEEKLARKSKKARSIIEERLLVAYDRLRSNAKNGLAVVEVQRNSCGGCYNSIPLQLQADIKQKNKIIACEHCGRILVPEKETETA